MMQKEISEIREDNTKSAIPITRKTDFRAGLVFFVLSVFVIIEAGKMPKKMPGVDFGPGILPFWLGIVLAVLSILLIVQATSGRNTTHMRIKKDELVGVLSLFGLLAVYLGLMKVIGFGLNTFLLVAFLTRRLGKYAYWKCLLLGGITGGLSVYLFRTLLNMPLPIGFFGF